MIMEGGIQGVAFYTLADRLIGHKTADTAPQRPANGQGNKDTPFNLKGWVSKADGKFFFLDRWQRQA